MDGLTLSLVCLAAILTLIALRTPIGVALGVVSFCGFWWLRGFNVALGQLREIPYYFAANWDLSAIPMFLLMGSIVYVSGIATALFRAARLWLSALPGGLAVAANVASAGFAAGCGSSVASSAAMGRLAIPEMLKAGYDKGLATGVVASAGTIAALIPPSILMVLYGIFAETSIVALLIAGIIPGLMTAAAYTAMIVIRCKLNPLLAPPITNEVENLRRERWQALGQIWPLIVLIMGVIGGLYAGVVTPTEAGAAGALLALVIAILQGRMTFGKLWEAIRDAVMTTAQIFFIGVGALMFTRLLSFSGASTMLADLVAPLGLDPLMILLAMTAIYLVLGMFLDPIGIMLITMPVFIPLLTAMDFNLIWYGVLVVKFIEIGMLTPPLGFNVFVVKGVVGRAIPVTTIFKGVGWFLVCDVIVLALLIAFPQISLFLPQLMN
jgi:C4-dicarboxylate transporter DctM subunit